MAPTTSSLTAAMPSIGPIDLQRCKSFDTKLARFAVACQLTSPLQEDLDYVFEAGAWAVIGVKGSRYLAALGRQPVDLDAGRATGTGLQMQALDLACVRTNTASNLQAPGDNYVVFRRSDEESVVHLMGTFNLGMAINMTAEVRNKNGELVPQPKAPDPQWHRAMRYYRLSQLSSDIYEAFRNLYLAFEALMSSLYPRSKEEREGEWVRRCFKALHQRFNLATHVPDGHKAPHEYLYGTLYQHTRCNLFHAQTVNSILPYYETAAERVQSAYLALLSIWRNVVAHELHAGGGGGVVTYQGYKVMSDNGFADVPIGILVSDDPSPPQLTDVELGPPTSRTMQLAQAEYLSEIAPGMVGFKGVETDIERMPVIHKLGFRAAGVLHAVAPIQGGLSLHGATRFEVSIQRRLIQGSVPKSVFL